MIRELQKQRSGSPHGREGGFTLVEVIIAAGIMIILCIGTLSVFTHAVKVNSGNNLRSQAQSVLQQEVEYYRGLKFVPGAETAADLPNHRLAEIYAGTITRQPRTAADGQVFNMAVTISNLEFSPGGTDEAHATFKQIVITATPAVAKTGWLANLNTSLTIQRVRSN